MELCHPTGGGGMYAKHNRSTYTLESRSYPAQPSTPHHVVVWAPLCFCCASVLLLCFAHRSPYNRSKGPVPAWMYYHSTYRNHPNCFATEFFATGSENT